VLITGSRAPVCVLLARLLTRAGYRVYTADSLRPTLAGSSRAVRADFPLPSPRFERRPYAEELVRLADAHGIETLIPTCEEIYHLAAERERLTDGVAPYFPSLQVLDTLHNKHSCAVLAESLELRVPETTLVRDATALDRLDFRHDGILKRVYSRFSSHVLPLLGSPEERQQAARRADFTGGAWVHQRFLRGRPVCTYSLCQEGRILYHLAYTTPYTVGLGAGVFYQSVPGQASLEVARRLAEATSFTGQLSLDLMEDAAGLWLLECNPRATMGLALALDQPAFTAAWRTILDDRPHPETAIAPAGLRRQVALATLLYGWKHRAPDRSPPRWLWDLLTTRDALWSLSDPGPSLVQLPILAGYSRRGRALGMAVTEFTTHDIEWNGDEATGATAPRELAEATR
jgi:glutathione synthase/RimK-type ligase-like ATP-grasp enzyme